MEEINSIAQQIADVNQQIKAITLSGQTPNDLIDRRDLLLDQISRLVDAQITVESNGMASILVGGAPLVMGVRTISLGLNTDNKGMYKVVWDLDPDTHPNSVITGRPASSDDIEVSITSGELFGLLDPQLAEAKLGQDPIWSPPDETLNQLAKAIVIDTNAIHRQVA